MLIRLKPETAYVLDFRYLLFRVDDGIILYTVFCPLAPFKVCSVSLPHSRCVFCLLCPIQGAFGPFAPFQVCSVSCPIQACPIPGLLCLLPHSSLPHSRFVLSLPHSSLPHSRFVLSLPHSRCFLSARYSLFPVNLHGEPDAVPLCHLTPN